MRRRVLAIILVVLAISIGVITPVLAFTPAGDSLLRSFAGAAPTPVPFTPTPTLRPTPILTVVGTPPVLDVKAAYLLDADSGHTLDDFHGEIPLPMASTTKIMTAIIAIQMGNLDRVITVHQDALNEVNNNMGSTARLQDGEKIKLGEISDPYEMYLQDVFTIPASLAGICGISIPGGFSEGLPVGLQLLGNIFAEDVILRVADAFERVTAYHKQWPKALAYA